MMWKKSEQRLVLSSQQTLGARQGSWMEKSLCSYLAAQDGSPLRPEESSLG